MDAARARAIIAEHLVVSADRVVPAASFVEDLGADSLDKVELAFAFEDEIGRGCELDDDDVSGIRTVADLYRLLKIDADLPNSAGA